MTVPGLTEAWAAAEAALPEGWVMKSLVHAVPAHSWFATAEHGSAPGAVYAEGPTPVAALTNLAAALRSHTDG